MKKNKEELLSQKRITAKEYGTFIFEREIELSSKPREYAAEALSEDELAMISEKMSQKTMYAADSYRTILDTLTYWKEQCQIYKDLFKRGHDSLFLALKDFYKHSDFCRIAEKQPLTVTQPQYDRLKAAASERLKSNTDSYAEVIMKVLKQFLTSDQTPTGTPELDAIAAAIEETRNQKAGAEYAIDYNMFYHENGYRVLPDGTRSDKVTKEEWKAAYSRILNERIERNAACVTDMGDISKEKASDIYSYRLIFNLFYKGKKAICDYVKERTGEDVSEASEEKLKAVLKYLYPITDGYQYIETDKYYEALQRAIYDTEYIKVFKPYPDFAEEKSIYDMLPSFAALWESTDTVFSFNHFKEAVPEVYKAIIAYLEKALPDLSLKGRSPLETFITWKQLEALDPVYKESSEHISDDQIIDQFYFENGIDYRKDYECFHNGLAIMHKSSALWTDENENYRPFERMIYFYKDPATLTENQKALYKYYAEEEMLPLFRYAYAYNELVSILQRKYELPDLSYFRQNVTEEEGAYELLFQFIFKLYFDTPGTPEQRKNRHAALKSIPYTELSTLRPTQEAIENLEADLPKPGKAACELFYDEKSVLSNLIVN